jgi:hypothetical protein
MHFGLPAVARRASVRIGVAVVGTCALAGLALTTP